MNKRKLILEHQRLVKVLKKGDKKELAKETKKQSKELKELKGKKK
jgi:hypothetical protein